MKKNNQKPQPRRKPLRSANSNVEKVRYLQPPHMRYAASQAYNAPGRVPENVVEYQHACEDLLRMLDIDYGMLYEDAYTIFQNNPTREGAEEASEFFVSALSEVREKVSSGLREAADRFLTHKQKRSLKIDKRLSIFDQNAASDVDNFRKMFVESAVNGTMDEIAAATHAFSSMINDALFA